MSSIHPPIAPAQQASNGFAPRLRGVGAFVLRYSLVFFLVFFGALKWTAAEAKAIEPMVSHSPFFFWLYPAFGVQGGSEVIGVVELVIALLIVVRRWAPRASGVGSTAAVGMFLVTLSFIVTTHTSAKAQRFSLRTSRCSAPHCGPPARRSVQHERARERAGSASLHSRRQARRRAHAKGYFVSGMIYR